MSLRLELDIFQHYDPGRSSATVNVWLAHPSPSEEQAFGKLMVLSSFDRLTRVNHEIIALIQEELRSQLYQSLEVGLDRAFEKALVQTNQRLHEAVAEGVNQWVDGANVLVVAIKQQTLLAAHVGQMHAYIVRRDRLHPILSAGDVVVPNALRMFGQVVTGQLEVNDRLLLCTSSLLDYFSLEKLRRLLIDNRPSEAVRQIETTLLSAEPHHAVAAIVLEAMAATETIAALPRVDNASRTIGAQENAPQASMDRLLSRQQATEQLLTPSIWPAVQDIMHSIGRSLSGFIRTVLLRKPPRRNIPGAVAHTSPRPKSPTSNSRVPVVLRGWLALAITSIKKVFQRRPAPLAAPAPLRPMKVQSPRESARRLVRWFSTLSPARRAAIGIVVLMLLSLSAALSLRGNQSKSASPLTDSTSQIRQLISQAQAALLYGGDATAQQAVTKADKLFSELPHRTKAEQATKQNINTELAAIHLRVDHVNTIDHPTVLTTFASTMSPRQLYHLGTTLVAADPQHNQVISLPDHGKATPTISTLTLDTGTITTGTAVNATTLVFSTDRQTFVQFTPSKQQWKPLDSAFPQAQPRIQSLASYLGRIYVLDTNHQAIIRFSFGGSSLGQGQAWLKTSAALSASRQLDVDGSVYVLQPQGKVQLFQTGRLTTFSLDPIHPVVQNPTRLWTDASAVHLYLVEPSQHRVMVFDKQGHLVDQYQSSTWTDLRDVVANEKTKTLYVLNGTSIETVALVH